MAQNEARLGVSVAEHNRLLAQSAREDSSAMKSLALVTLSRCPILDAYDPLGRNTFLGLLGNDRASDVLRARCLGHVDTQSITEATESR